MGRGQPPGKLRNTQNKDTGQQPVRTPLVDRCGRTENSIENSRLDRLGDLGYALAPKTTRPARQHPQELPYLPAAMGIPFTATLPIFPSSHRDGCQAASVSRAATWLGRRRGHSPAQNAVFRKGPYAECAFPLRCGAREVWGNRPPGCGALWRMPQLGKCARATPRQPAGRVVPGSANLGSESGLTERRTLPNRWASECAFPSRRDRRVRLSVRTETPTRDTLGACRLLKRTKQVIPAHTAIWP